MRVRVRIDVRKPLKRKKNILKKNGEEVIVTCKYERLGKFCFTCGVMTHTERYCKHFFLEKWDEEISKDCESWLRAPPRRSSGPARSKWLREEGDFGWEERADRGGACPKSQEFSFGRPANQLNQMSNFRDAVQQTGIKDYPIKVVNSITTNQGFSINSNLDYGPDDDELIGLELSDRKRLRGGPDTKETMNTASGLSMSPEVNNVSTTTRCCAF